MPLMSNVRRLKAAMKVRRSAKRKTSSISAVREWLQENKIFFEVSAAVLIGGASLVVSWSALQVGEQTLAATEVSSLPHFALSKEPRFDPSTQKFVEESLALNNHGAPISNWDWTVKTFVAIEKYGERRGKIFVPLDGYYNVQYRGSVSTGQLAKAVGQENLQRYADLYIAALNAKGPDGIGVHISLEVVSVVSYEDRFGRRSKVFFRNYDKVPAEEVGLLLAPAPRTGALKLQSVSLADLLSASQEPSAVFLPGK
jgi:hypothetical protein